MNCHLEPSVVQYQKSTSMACLSITFQHCCQIPPKRCSVSYVLLSSNSISIILNIFNQCCTILYSNLLFCREIQLLSSIKLRLTKCLSSTTKACLQSAHKMVFNLLIIIADRLSFTPLSSPLFLAWVVNKFPF